MLLSCRLPEHLWSLGHQQRCYHDLDIVTEAKLNLVQLEASVASATWLSAVQRPVPGFDDR